MSIVRGPHNTGIHTHACAQPHTSDTTHTALTHTAHTHGIHTRYTHIHTTTHTVTLRVVRSLPHWHTHNLFHKDRTKPDQISELAQSFNFCNAIIIKAKLNQANQAAQIGTGVQVCKQHGSAIGRQHSSAPSTSLLRNESESFGISER